jgi:hypothetical protein
MTDIATIEIEISRLQAEAAAVERAGPVFDEVWAGVEAQLLEAEAAFRRHGPQLGVVVSELPEYRYQRRQIEIGAAMVANPKALLDSERARIKAQTEGGISATDRQRRLDQLRAAILRAAGQRELALREVEGEGEFLPRPVHPELAIFRHGEVERLTRVR